MSRPTQDGGKVVRIDRLADVGGGTLAESLLDRRLLVAAGEDDDVAARMPLPQQRERTEPVQAWEL
jgi:hypothetical protein